jgi:hypothetical protein
MALRDVPITPGSGDNVQFDDKEQVVKVSYGEAGSHTLMPEKFATEAAQTTGNASLSSIDTKVATASAQATLEAKIDTLTTALSPTPADYAPGYGASPTDPIPPSVDEGGYTAIRGPVMTDEGGYRDNFAGSSLAVSIGTCTFANGSTTVTGTGFDAVDLQVGCYVYLDADGVAAAKQIDGFTPTEITLVSAYTGTGGTGASSRQIEKSVVGAGGSITVSGGQATIAAGTTAASIFELERDVDILPLVKESKFSVSQRIANQDIYFGFYDENNPARWYYWFHFTGTVNTVVNCVCAWNPSAGPSGGEISTQTITLPASVTTAASNTYRVEMLKDRVFFYINEILVATERRVVPHPHDFLVSTLRVVNGTTPATNTNVVVDYITCANFNVVSTENPSNNMTITNPNVPATEVLNYNVGGVIAINTDLGIFDANQFRAFSVQCISMGTTGAVTAAASFDGGTTWTAIGIFPVGGGTVTTTFNAAGAWIMPGLGALIRLRLTTATTAGTTTIRVRGMHQVPFFLVNNVSVTPGTAGNNLGKAEDSATSTGDVGVFVLSVRRDALTTSASAAADYNEVACNRFGANYAADFRTAARTYSSAMQVTVPASATDVMDMFGNGTSTVVVTRISISGIATSTGQVDMQLVKRSTANTAGTRVAGTVVPLDAGDAAASSTPGVYTANPTTGTLVGAVGRTYVPLSTNAAGGEASHEWSFGARGKGIVLSGTAQGLALNLNGVSVAGGVLNIEIEWYEF